MTDKFELPAMPCAARFISDKPDWTLEKIMEEYAKTYAVKILKHNAKRILSRHIESSESVKQPDFFTYMIDGQHRSINEKIPPVGFYDEGTLQALYLEPPTLSTVRVPSDAELDHLIYIWFGKDSVKETGLFNIFRLRSLVRDAIEICRQPLHSTKVE